MPKWTVIPTEEQAALLKKAAELDGGRSIVSLLLGGALEAAKEILRRHGDGKPPSNHRQFDGTETARRRHGDGTGEYKGDLGGFSSPESITNPGVVKPHGRPHATHEKGHPGFDEFWAAFPKRCPRRSKAAALKRWNQHKPDLGIVLEALAWQDTDYPDWQKEGGSFIEAPDRWLHNKFWTRERPEAAAAPVLTENPCHVGERDWLYFDRKLGHTSALYPEQSREWREHRAVEMGIKPAPTPTVAGGY